MTNIEAKEKAVEIVEKLEDKIGAILLAHSSTITELAKLSAIEQMKSNIDLLEEMYNKFPAAVLSDTEAYYQQILSELEKM